MGELVVGSGMQVISPTPLEEGAWTHTTLLVVPRSMPTTVARPRNPIRAMTTKNRRTTQIMEGIRASIPPDLESSACLLAILDFFFFFMIRLLDVVVLFEIVESCLDHDCCRSLFRLRLSCDMVDDVEDDVEFRGEGLHFALLVLLLLDGESFASASCVGGVALLISLSPLLLLLED